MEKKNLSSLLAQADLLRFKLLAIVGKDEEKKNKIISFLQSQKWTLIDVEKELLDLRKSLMDDDNSDEMNVEISTKIKEWFNSQPNNIILTNASILYHDIFLKSSPIGAFKYNSRNKNCVLFLEDESKLGNRIHYGEFGSKEYWEKNEYDIVLVNIDEIDDNFLPIDDTEDTESYEDAALPENAIGNFFNFEQIKDVIDIDTDLSDLDKQKNIVSSFIMSENLEEQIIEFFDDLEKPTHKVRNIIGNYGSGKSHLIAFLVSLIENHDLFKYIKNERVKKRVESFNRKLLTVNFELQAGEVELRKWFFDKVQRQLSQKYGIDIPKIDLKENYDDKENIAFVMETIKKSYPEAGLLIVIDEVSDFLSSKQKEMIRQDLQFLRIMGQTAQTQDFMLICSMQEDVFSSPKFKDIAKEIGRVEERFQNIIIHKEDVEKVISERIVPKTEVQKARLEQKMAVYMEKIEEVSKNIDLYINLFPLTPTLINMFTSLPYFEKRGVIQFSIWEVKKVIRKPFPFFITLERIYDLLANDPNKKQLQEIKEAARTVEILKDKIKLIDEQYQEDAIRIIKALAVLFIKDGSSMGTTAKELANNLMIVPNNKIFKSEDHIAIIIKKIREATDGEYIKIKEDKTAGLKFIYFDTKIGVDPEEKIKQKADAVSNDEIESELFEQIQQLLDLDEIFPNIFEDECSWESKKSYRKGIVAFQKTDNTLNFNLDNLKENIDYAVVFVSPSYKKKVKEIHKNQLEIYINLKGHDILSLLREILAIKQLINLGFQKNVMERKLRERIEGKQVNSTFQQGFRNRITKMLINYAEFKFNDEAVKADRLIGNKDLSFVEMFNKIKTSVFDNVFSEIYPLHPKYSENFSSLSITNRLDEFWKEINNKNGFNNISYAAKNFLKSLDLLDYDDFPSISSSKIAQYMMEIIKRQSDKMTKIEEIVDKICLSEYGLEKDVVYFLLAFTTMLGKTVLIAKGGTKIDIDNISDKLTSLRAFETIAYVQLQKSQSFDFASRLLNTFNLNGQEILNDNTRFKVFREYKEKVTKTIEKIEQIHNKVKSIKQSSNVYLNLNQLDSLIAEIDSIKWQEFDIPNINKFSSLEKYDNQIPKIKQLLIKIEHLADSLNEYDTIRNHIKYIDSALELIESNEILKSNLSKIEKLKEVRDEIISICGDLNLFMEPQHRASINGKAEQFRDIYIKYIYYPAHEKYIGKDVAWSDLDDIISSDTFKRISKITKIPEAINESKFIRLRNRINEIKSYRCDNSDIIEDLKNSCICQKCHFPEPNKNYPKIIAEINTMNDTFKNLLREYEETLLNSIREYRDNVSYLNTPEEKKLVENILETKQLPNNLTDEAITTIGKLFKEIKLVRRNRDEVIEKLFPNDEIMTIDKIRENFNKWLLDIVGNDDESLIRIRLESKDEDK